MVTSIFAKSLDPWAGVVRDLDQIFATTRRDLQRNTPVFSPIPYDIEEIGDHFVLRLDVPGVPKDDLNIEVLGNRLLISGERKSASKNAQRRSGKFQHSFELPEGSSADAIEADLQQGVLTIMIHKPIAATAKKIAIRAGTDHAEGSFKNGFRGNQHQDEQNTSNDQTSAPTLTSCV